MSQPKPLSESLPSAAPSCSPDDTLFVQAMEEYLAGLEAGERPDRRELLRRYPEHAEALGEFLDGLDFVHDVAPQLCKSPADGVTQRSSFLALGDFRIIREVGRGGMGVVYEAEQLSLGRRVALKVLPYAAVLDKKQLVRFKNEAQAAAQLRHPNIVGVHFVGCERGVHYYAMELVHGKSLAELISEERQKTESADDSNQAWSSSPQVPLEDETQPLSELSTMRSIPQREYFRSVARLGMQAAQALEYAHDAGVVHRDIKPSNLLVETEGHLWIADFGLAMTQTDAGLTLTGDLLGTLRYMSPEQAVGNRIALDHRTDIYSLGVTLYELLTLRVPFDSKHRHELLRDIVEREPRPLRYHRRSVPRDLETVVLKAMAKEPGDRYRTAYDLAEDLGRFLNEEPIHARRPSVARRLSKWSRRHRIALGMGACVLGVIVTIGVALLWQQRARTLTALAQARHNFDVAQTQRIEAERQRELAEANFRREQKTVEELLMHMAVSLNDVPHTVHVRGALLKHALQYYLGFLQERPTDPEVRFDTAQAYLRIATIADRLQHHEQHENSSRDALALLTRLVEEAPDVPRYAEALARAHEKLGRNYYAERNINEAEREHRRALAISMKLAQHSDPHGVYRLALASNHTHLGFTLASSHNDQRRFEEGLAELRRGLLLREELVRELGRFDGELAQSHRLLGGCLARVGRFSEAQPHLDNAVVLLTRMRQVFPDIVNYTFALADSQSTIGQLHLRVGRPRQAADAFQQCAQIREQITKDYSAFYDERKKLASSYELLGEALIHSGRPPAAEVAFRKCLAVRQQVRDELSPQIVDHGGISWCHHGLALVFQAADRPADAEQAFRQAIKIRQQLIEEHPDAANYQRYLAWGNYELAILLRELGRDREAGELFQQTLEIFEQLMAGDAPSSKIRMWFALFIADCPDARYRNAERAVEISRQLLGKNPNSAEAWNLLGLACYRADCWDEAIKAFVKSTELRSAEDDLVPCHEWLFLGAAHWQLGKTEEGRQWYDRTMAWMRKNELNVAYHELRRWVPEVTALLSSADEIRAAYHE